MAFVQRLGISKANEALIQSKRISAQELLAGGVVNIMFETGKGEQGGFLEMGMREVEREFLGEGNLNGESLLKVKEMIRRPGRTVMGAQTVEEVFGGLERFVKGVPQEEFRRVASGEKKHKL